MEYSLWVYILLFFIYSFAGWLMEVITVSIGQKKLVSRGFLIGPYLPIYGLRIYSYYFTFNPIC